MNRPCAKGAEIILRGGRPAIYRHAMACEQCADYLDVVEPPEPPPDPTWADALCVIGSYLSMSIMVMVAVLRVLGVLE